MRTASTSASLFYHNRSLLTSSSTQGFRDFLFQFNKDLMAGSLPTSRAPITAEVVQVAENVRNSAMKLVMEIC
jgi:hypothetical protein